MGDQVDQLSGPAMRDVAAGAEEAREHADVRRVFEESVQPMWVTSASRILDVNRAALRHYGYSRDEFLAMSALDLQDAEGSLRRAVLALEVARGAGTSSVVGRHRKRDGSLINVRLTSFAIMFGGKPATLVSVIELTYLRSEA